MSERTEELAFVPLSADVAPQLTLFGGPAPAPPISPAPSRPATNQTAPELPAFERRAQLRAERHRLVSDLRRRDGTSHREINAWLNRKLGKRATMQRDKAPATVRISMQRARQRLLAAAARALDE